MSHQARKSSGFQRALEVWNRRKWLATVVFMVVFAGSLSAIWALPPLYRSSATVVVDRREVPDSFVRSAVTGELEPRLDAISQELLSRARLEAVVTRFDLYRDLRRQEGTPEAAVQQMRRDIQFAAKATEQPGGKNTTIAFTLSYRGMDPDTVARVTNALATSYVEENSRVRERQAAGTAQFLKGQLAEVKQKVEEQERILGAQPQPVETELAALERLNTRLKINTDRQLRALDRRERVVRGFDVVEGPGGTISPSGGAESITARLAKLKHELTELRTRFSDKYPDVIRVKSEIAALERQRAEEPPETPPAPERGRARRDAAATGQDKGGQDKGGQDKDPLKEINAELKALKDEEQTLRQAIATYEGRADNAPRRQQEYQRQARDYATLKEQYQSLLKRYEEAQVAESMEQGLKGEQFRILDGALPAKEPIAPSRARLGMMGLILALGTSVGAVVLAETFDGSFHSVDELRAFSKVPVLAGIPRLVTEADTRRRIRRRWLAALSLLIILALVAAAAYLFAYGNEGLVRLLAITSGR